MSRLRINQALLEKSVSNPLIERNLHIMALAIVIEYII
jgi:hypothetical protein